MAMHTAARRLWTLGLFILVSGLVACGDSDDDTAVDPPGIGDEPGFGFKAGKALELTDKWQWVDVPGAVCQDGSDYGFFAKKGKVDRLVVYLEGGGACFREDFCKANPQSFGGDAAVRRRDAVSVMDDATPGNPFKDWNKVFLGYCSGDIYSGVKTNKTGFGNRTQQGFINVGLVLERVVPTFTEVDDVVLTGSSAGGFGALFNWLRVQEAFDAIPVTLVNDSGPALANEYLTPCFQKLTGMTWGWEKTLPPGCKDCDKAVSSIMPYYLSKFPNHRFSLLSYTKDSTIRLFFGNGLSNCNPEIPNIPGEAFTAAIKDVGDSLAKYDNFALWAKEGTSHTFLISEDLEQKVDGVKLSDWLQGAVDGGENFKRVGP